MAKNVICECGDIKLLEEDAYAEDFYKFSGVPVRCTSGFIAEMGHLGMDYQEVVKKCLSMLYKTYPNMLCDYVQMFLVGDIRVYLKSDVDSRIDPKEYGDYAKDLGVTVLLPSEN